MDIYEIRDAVKGIYPNETWARQVDQMDNDRVFVIFMKNLRDPPELPQKEQPPEQGQIF